MMIPADFLRAGLDRARQLLPPIEGETTPARDVGVRILLCSAIIEAGYYPRTTAYETLAFSPARALTPKRLAAAGVTEEMITVLAGMLGPKPPSADATFAWSDANITELEYLQGLKWTAAAIAHRLGTTRGSVCSKIRGLQRAKTRAPATPRIPSSVPRPPRRRPPATPRAPRRPAVLAEPIVLTPEGRPDTARPWEERPPATCAWPYEVEGATWSCCLPVVDRFGGTFDAAYCARHGQEMFAPPPRAAEKLPFRSGFDFSTGSTRRPPHQPN